MAEYANWRIIGAMADTPETPREYYVAIRPSPDAPLNVFGPYTIAEAKEFRAKWRKAYPASARMSLPFHADSRDQANLRGHFYMPAD